MPLSEERKLKIVEILNCIVGKDNVFHTGQDLILYTKSLLPKSTLPLLAVQPATSEEIQAILSLVKKESLKLHVISTGKNWGYTDAQHDTDGAIIMSLKRMNNILEINKDLGYVTIEPGVTQGQLYNELLKVAPNLCADATGSSQDTSVIGNILERGFGHSMYGDRYSHSVNYEIILPTGEIINTGFTNTHASTLNSVYKWGIGPSIDGLFIQSRFGIVTKMTIWLFPRPENLKIVYFGLKKENDIYSLVEKLRMLKMEKTVNSVVHISNDLRVLSTLVQYPAEKSMLTKKQRDDLSAAYGLRPWMGSVGFYGTNQQINVDIARTKKVLKNGNMDFFFTMDEKKILLIEKTLSLLYTLGFAKKISPLYKNALNAFYLLKGKPPLSVSKALLWRKKETISQEKILNTDPLLLDVGLIWISPLIPMTSHDLRNAIEIMEDSFTRNSFDLMVSLSTINDRTMCAVTSIHYDKNNEEESKRAIKCHDETVEVLMKNGYVPYRAGNLTKRFIEEKASQRLVFLKNIQQAIDPDGIFTSEI